MHHFNYSGGRLHCEGVDLDAVASAVGTPCYLYSSGTLVRHGAFVAAHAQHPLSVLAEPDAAYRAIVRLKVYAIRVQQTTDAAERAEGTELFTRYFELYVGYWKELVGATGSGAS